MHFNYLTGVCSLGYHIRCNPRTTNTQVGINMVHMALVVLELQCLRYTIYWTQDVGGVQLEGQG